MKAISVVLTIFFITLCVVSSAVVRPESPKCQSVRPVEVNDSLDTLSNDSFGTPKYRYAILLATNAMAAEAGYRFLSDPDQLPVGTSTCIPPLHEAERLESTYENYLAAVADSVRPNPADVSNSLVAIDVQQPVRVVAWMRADQVAKLKTRDGAWVDEALDEIWVTVVPKLQSFCRAFAKTHHATTDELKLRLEQRLGLPPGANKSTMVEMIVENPSTADHIFRPCADSSVWTSTCHLGRPVEDGITAQHRDWIYRQYYMSFAVAHPDPYPWTSLGYTFDWASDETGRSRFVRAGESEFVIPRKAPIAIQSATPTAEYCAGE